MGVIKLKPANALQRVSLQAKTAKLSRVYTLDIETDPFVHGERPEAFAIDFYDGVEHVYFWGNDCVDRMFTHLQHVEPGIIFIHNGGRFDILGYLLHWVLSGNMRIINSRIILSTMKCGHELRDSYAIMPFALGKFKGAVQKKKIEMWKLKKEHREKYKDEIVDYLFYDCIVLYTLCSAFVNRFGPMMTIGSTAMKEIKKLHTFENLDKEQDLDIRTNYYYGGRVQCFKSGIIKGNYKLFDLNSAYPYVMKYMKHPIGKPSDAGKRIGKDTCFISVLGKNKGAFPTRTKSGIDFTVPYGIFHVTRHEWDAAEEYGLFEPERIIRTVDFSEQATFAEFVDLFYSEKVAAKLAKDAINELFAKFLLNSGYGKFGQNPENYKEYCITLATENMSGDGWICDTILGDTLDEEYIVWSKPTKDTSRYNVATGSSITGGTRSVLLRGIAQADTPLYCDTDSIIAKALSVANLGDTELGAWKLEAEFNYAAIARKKLYTLIETNKKKIAARFATLKTEEEIEDFKANLLPNGWMKVKQANKGVVVSAQEIIDVCQGKTVVSKRDAPSFKLDGSHTFISRKVKMS